jgi:hypothetical protein
MTLRGIGGADGGWAHGAGTGILSSRRCSGRGSLRSAILDRALDRCKGGTRRYVKRNLFVRYRAADIRLSVRRRSSAGHPLKAKRLQRIPGTGLVLLLGKLGDERFGREQEPRDRRRVLERRAGHLGRADDAGLEEVFERMKPARSQELT